jgi:ribosomal protein S18 acetylase RimI-like enzyme
MVMISIADEQDGRSIQAITSKTTMFSPEEVDCVTELWEEYRQNGAQASGYYFIVEREDGRVRGYACYGPRSLTDGTYDLYWIAVDPECRRAGVGRLLLDWVEKEICKMGGRLIVVETSGLEKYAPTRRFYLATGYILEATLKDFYKDGDDLVIFTKHVKKE